MIPYQKITAVIGVSGSGKSSLVFDTIYAECQSRMSGISDYAKDMKRPDLESMQGVIPAIAVTQQDIGQNSRSTVGTYSDSYSYIRRIYATIGIRHCPECGKAIFPMTEEEIAEIVKEEKLEICGQTFEAADGSSIEDIVKRSLENGKGALRVKRLGGESFYLQTTQMCYECNRILFECSPATFNYSDSESMCPVCSGYGVKYDIDAMTIVEHPELSILEGASSFWGKLKSFAAHPNANWMKGEVLGLAQKEGIDLSLPWEKLPEKFRTMAIYGCSDQLVQFSYKNEKNGRSGTIERPVVGAYHYLERFFREHPEQKALEKYRKEVVCDACNGERLKAEGRLVTVNQLRFPEVAGMTFTELAKWCMELPESLTESHLQLVKADIRKLYQLATRADHLGISYLEMDRSVTTLSGGEQQRLKLLAGISQNISGVLYILDEPSRGLHPKDYDKIKTIIRELCDSGNTILLVEHNKDMIQMADHIIEIGPGAGEKGGYLVGSGSIESMLKNPQSTLLQLLENKEEWSDCQQKKISKEDLVSIDDASFRNLNHISVSFPLKAMTCICGVSGSGKSSLMNGIIEKAISDNLAGMKREKNTQVTTKKNQIDEIIVVNQTAIGRTPRSVPATYMGIMDHIRVLFAETEEAREKELDRNAFSFNSSEGQCETCQGGGMITPRFSEDIWVTCPHCNGKRYKKRILEIRYHNHNISEVLEMTIQEAATFLKDQKEISHILNTLTEVGLGYLKLGQNSASLSGGEAARLKMAKQLVSKKKKHTLYLLDEPTTGLHISDVKKLLSLFQKLVKEGNTLVMIEHNKQVLHACEWIIEVGPGAGKDGGRIMRVEAVR